MGPWWCIVHPVLSSLLYLTLYRRSYRSALMPRTLRLSTSLSLSPSFLSAGYRPNHVSWQTRSTLLSPFRLVQGIALAGSKNENRAHPVKLLLTEICSLAMAEARLIIAKVMWRFDMQCMVQGNRMNQRTYLLWEKQPLPMKLTPAKRPK